MAPNDQPSADQPSADQAQGEQLSSVSWLVQAGAALIETDPLAAVEHLTRAKSLMGHPDLELVGLLAQAFVWTNRADDAIELIETWTSMSTTDGVDQPVQESVTLRLVVAQGWAALGELQVAADLFEAAVAEDAGDPSWQRAFAEAQILRAMSFQEPVALANVERLLAAPHVDPLAEVHARCALSWAYKNAGRVDEAVAEARRALGVERPAELQSARSPTIFLADALLAGDRFDEFDEAARAARLEVLHHGDVWQVPALASMICGAEMRRGNWRRAWSEADGGIGWATETGNRLALPWLLSLQSAMASWQGKSELADRLLVAAETEMDAAPRSGIEVLLWARAVQASVVGSDGAAHELFASIWNLAVELGLVARLPMLGPDVVRAALLAGDRSSALDAAALLDGLDASIVSLGPCRTLVRGLLEDDPEAFAIAADGYLRIGLRVDAAKALADGAGAAHRRGQALASLATQARQLNAELGAGGLQRQLDRVVPAVPVVAPGSVLDSLSPAERRVAELVATGVSNPAVATELHISRRTVESHLARIFAKLGLRTRVELALLVASEQP